MVGEIAAGSLIGGSGLLTIIISKIRCFYKHAAEFPCGCGFTDSQLADNDDVHISFASVNGVNLLYVGKRKHITKNDTIAVRQPIVVIVQIISIPLNSIIFHI